MLSILGRSTVLPHENAPNREMQPDWFRDMSIKEYFRRLLTLWFDWLREQISLHGHKISQYSQAPLYQTITPQPVLIFQWTKRTLFFI